MHYRTRVMVAQADFLHGADLLLKGDTFVATQIDADYLFSRGRAIYAPEPAPAAKAETPAPAPAAAPAVEEPVAVASAPSVEQDAPVHQEAAAAEPAAESHVDAESAADVKTEAAPAHVAPARRGGRRSAQTPPASE